MIQPLVSIVCATYNQEKYIAQALDSFLMQQCNCNFEIIIHDDCSTDGTTEIVREYEKKHPNQIKPIFQTENIYSKGQKPWVYCFKKAKGKYIALCDGDDYWTDPLKLQKQVDFLELNNSLIACHHWQKHAVKNDGKFVEVDSPKDGYLPKEISSVKEIFSNKMRIKTRTLMFRNIIGNDFFPSWFSKMPFGDVAFSFLLGKHGDFGFINEEMAVYRITFEGVSTAGLKELGTEKFRVEHFKNWIEIWDKANIFYSFKYNKEAVDTVKFFFLKIITNSPLNFLALLNILSYNIKNRELSFLKTFPVSVYIAKTFGKMYLKKVYKTLIFKR